jgi:hypothetical protein
MRFVGGAAWPDPLVLVFRFSSALAFAVGTFGSTWHRATHSIFPALAVSDRAPRS